MENQVSWIGAFGKFSIPVLPACNYWLIPSPDFGPKRFGDLSPIVIGETLQSFTSTGQKDRLYLIVLWCPFGMTTHFVVCGTKTILARLLSCNPEMRPIGSVCCTCSQRSLKHTFVIVSDELWLTKHWTFITATLGGSADETIQYIELPEQEVNA